MTFLLVRSIPLSRETRDAWKEQGGVFLRREHNEQVQERLGNRYDYCINLGSTKYSGPDSLVVYNRPDAVRAVSHPVNLRKTFQDANILPEFTVRGPHWHKNGGWRGQGKVFHEGSRGDCAVMPGDSQKHVDGTEYRVITVGDVVVQAHRKEHDGDPLNGFDWYWVGVRGIGRSGIIPMVKEAVSKIPFGQRTVLGWDIIVGDKPYVLEINTSPGVNFATAERIVNQIRRVL